MRSKFATVTLAGAAVLSLCGGAFAADAAKDSDEMPTFRYDPDWPKPLPNAWMPGNIGAIYMDKNDHLWVAQRPASTTGLSERYALEGAGACCAPAPPVLEIDTAGNLLRHWGPIHIADPADQKTRRQILVGKQVSPPYPDGVWPSSEHGIATDDEGNVWVNGSGPSTLLKLSPEGKLLLQIGKKESDSGTDTASLGSPAGVWVDSKAKEVFVADGYRNRRVVVFDTNTGAFKRQWGAYGKPPTAQQHNSAVTGPDLKAQRDHLTVVHCIIGSNDGLLYVCDRANSRVQVFKKDGSFVSEVILKPKTVGFGTVYAMALSADPQQRFVYVGNGSDREIIILRRSDLKVLGSFGSGGREGGRFMLIHTLATDSKGNLYVGETVDNNRVQRFVLTGMTKATAK